MSKPKQAFLLKFKKILILLPDGVGLRNFAFTSFVEKGKKQGWEVIFWNQTAFDLTKFGYREIKIKGRPRPQTDLLKRAKIEAELDHFTLKFNDPVYQSYKFLPSTKGLRRKLKNLIVTSLVRKNKGEKGLVKLRESLKNSERKSEFYRLCKKELEKEKPDLVFCTNQRPVNAIAPLTAAEDLGIPTATFIFSWDNLPKATMVVQPDYYFVWSGHMKKELLNYYPYINPEQIHITGSPQFEPHFNISLRKTKEEFFRDNNLDLQKEYICFSGDDVTTSPDDAQYLNDLAEGVNLLNKKGFNIGIIFRRCPVDFSNRYNLVLEKFKKTIVKIDPKWKRIGDNWNTVLPAKQDLELQINTIIHSRLVINLGSSMVFDFALFQKPCIFLNYEVEHKSVTSWSPEKVYNFVHFRSMPTRKEVYWLNSKQKIVSTLELALEDKEKRVPKALNWFENINYHPVEKASDRIWAALEEFPN